MKYNIFSKQIFLSLYRISALIVILSYEAYNNNNKNKFASLSE